MAENFRTLDRRHFLHTAAVGLAAGSLLNVESSKAQQSVEAEKPFRKAVKFGMVQGSGTILEKFKLLKELGYDGVELDAPSNRKLEEVLQARDESGLPIHGVVDSAHWKDTLSDPDPEVRARGVKALEGALRDAKAYGATTVLLVPAVVSKTVSYADAYKRSQTEIRKVLPLATELGIKIGIENVWNNFLLSPLELARYLDEFESPMIGSYFDVGNVLRYGWPEHWIRTLGPRIVKLDIKEYSLEKMNKEGVYKGFNVELLEGDCDWPSVMAALREIKFTGWGTAEIPGGERERLTEIAKRMDRIFTS